jgi:hypothetical protein
MSDKDLQDYADWLSFHGCDDFQKIGEKIVDGESKSLLKFRIPIVCVHLSFDMKTGMSYCGIYEGRPNICKNYVCKRELKNI